MKATSKMYKLFYLVILSFLITFTLCFIPSYGEESIQINIPSRTLEIWKNNRVIKSYPVGVGRKNFPTPTGNFKIISKFSAPTWENPYKAAGEARIYPGSKNPLGTRWIGFHRNSMGEYGIHGTNEPYSVGKICSHGCIRMRIKNSEDLYNNVQIGTPVAVTYYTYKLKIKNNNIYVYKYPNPYNRRVDTNKMIYEQLSKISSDYTLNLLNLDKLKTLQNGQKLLIGNLTPKLEE